MAFDTKCDALAAHFLPEEASVADKANLAQYIQDAVEEWLEDNGYGPDKEDEDEDEAESETE